MKRLLFLVVLLLWPVISICQSKEQKNSFRLVVTTDKKHYSKNDEIEINALLINETKQEVFVYGTLDWGFNASLRLVLRDATGKLVQPRFFADSAAHLQSREDISQFVKLIPYHSLGRYTTWSIPQLFSKPGKYSILVEYHSPLTLADVDVRPFYGKENRAVRSNVVSIEVR